MSRFTELSSLIAEIEERLEKLRDEVQALACEHRDALERNGELCDRVHELEVEIHDMKTDQERWQF